MSSIEFSFFQWQFIPVQNLLVNTDDGSEHVLEAKQADLLVFLIEHHQQIVSREQLVEHVWQNRYVDDKTVNSTISRIRKILGGNINEYIKTHPKKGYSFVAPVISNSTQKPELKVKTSNKRGLLIGVTSLCLIIFAIAAALKILQQQGITQPLANDTPTPITDYIGWEMFPQINSDNLLAYIYYDTESRTTYTKVQTIASRNIREVLSLKEAYFPTWSNEGDTLYYQQWDANSCTYEYQKLLADQTFSKPQQLATCSLAERSLFSIDNNQQWIYFDGVAQDGKSRIIKRRDITTDKVEELTRPGITYNDDRNVSLSPNGQYIAFIREYNKRDHQLMLLDLYNGQITSLAKVSKTNYVSRPTWHKSGEEIFYVSDDIAISSVNINSKKSSLRYQANEPISHVAISYDNQLVFMQGKQVIANAVQVNLANDSLKPEYIARSTFENYAATTFRNNTTNKSAFVSFRSESEQIWLKQGTNYTQLTDFSDGGTTYLLFSNDGEQLLFMRQQALYFLDINSKKISPAKLPWQEYNYPYWQCGSNNEIILSALENGQWNLYQYNIETHQTQKVLANVASYHHSCEQNRRFVTLPGKKGIFELDGSGQILKEHHFFNDTMIRHWRNWDAYDNKLFVMTSYAKFIELDLTTMEQTERQFTDLSTWAINVEYGYMVLNKSTEKDTHLAMVPIH
ncbi:winged helix-turn-helix domain-containing protein [Thalassotalea marina]|uniref:OmpR/PhoB-type domain-containing protein n=1 Tax=Thalassotalea marina TaxID=1673741 RepID=A0A919BQM0_9GAMM|nr:winged helix-turn-helix domain-containing protein [Thalassotalea marina]GHG03736.1 hypothetical protein GCM10017161_36270 [Thalassotalea marina]